MSFKPTAKQALFLWKLITAETQEEREPMLSKARPELQPQKERKPLIDQGFVNLVRKPGSRGIYYVLTDKAWAWAAGSFDVEILRSRSSVGAEALQGLLRRLLPFLQQHDLPLASLFASSSTADAPASKHEGAGHHPASNGDSRPSELPEQIEAACLAIAGGARKTRVRLRDLRKHLDEVRREALDQALLTLQDEGRLVLYRDDNTAALTEDDHRAALHVGNAPRHLVYLEA